MKSISILLSAVLFFNTLPVFSLEAAPDDKEYSIAAGDVISVNVFPAQEFSKEVTVQPDGNVELPLIGSLRAQGMKPGELEKMLTAKFSKFVSDPSITVNVRRFSFNRVALIGHVRGPGYYEYREGMRLLELVAQAGGTADYSREAKVRIFRKTNSGGDKVAEQVIQANLEDVFSGDMEKNILLQSGDIVYIPKKPYYAAGRWISDNIVPWATLFMFGITLGLVARQD